MKLKLLYYTIFFRIRKNMFVPKMIKDRLGINVFNILDDDNRNTLLCNAIKGKHPFLASRYGATELFCMRTDEFSDTRKMEKAVRQLCLWSGFFPNDIQLLQEFNRVMKNASEYVDVMVKWDKPAEEYFLKQYCVNLKGLCNELILMGNPSWTYALKGKKVLVIHPFRDTILKQYEKREYLFDNPNVLPDFELIVIKAIQTLADEKDERFSNWFEALQFMYRQVDMVDFDVAIIGCGAYGLPLGAYIKNKGKVALHMGADVQLLFGIKGKRWDHNPEVSKLYNEYWVNPSEEERPKGVDKVENACYW